MSNMCITLNTLDHGNGGAFRCFSGNDWLWKSTVAQHLGPASISGVQDWGLQGFGILVERP